MTTPDKLDPDTSHQAPLQDILAESCRELFAAYDIDVSGDPSEEDTESQALVGRIHFAGRHMSGNLTIGLDRDRLQRSLPFKTDREEHLEDWARELANQLMGIVKTHLQQYGVNVILSLPLTVREPDEGSAPRWPSRISQFSVSCDFAKALSSLDGVMIAEVQLRAPTKSPSD